MSTTYPTITQTFTNPAPGNPLNAPSHAGLHDDIQDTLVAVQNAVGTTGAFLFVLTTATINAAHGGTGNTSLTAHAVLLGEGTGAVGFASTGTAGQLLIDQGTGADPAFKAISGSGATITLSAAGVITISAIANASLTNNSVTVTAGTGLSGGGTVALGGSITLSLTNPVAVNLGGTGLATLTAHAVMIGEGTGNVAFATTGTAGQLLIDQGAAADPAFKVLSGDGTLAASGALTLAASGATAGSEAVSFLTVNAKGLITSITAATGSSLPGSPQIGAPFLWQTTGRSWLMQWDGSVWQPIIAYGATTLFVDTTNGTDAQSKGTGTGANAYKTIQFAVNQLPPTLGGNAIINVAAGTYAEQVTIQGKALSGNFTLTINGTKATDTVGPTTATSGANPVGNGTAGFGTVTKTGATFPALTGLYLEITGGTGSGQIRPVFSNTATVITITGRWATVPDATSVFHVFDLGTTIDAASVRNYGVNLVTQAGVVLNQLNVQNGVLASIFVQNGSQCSLTNCTVKGGLVNVDVQFGSLLTHLMGCVLSATGFIELHVAKASVASEVIYCLITGTVAGAIGILVESAGVIGTLWQSYINETGASTNALAMHGGSSVTTDDYMVFDGKAGTSDNVLIDTSSSIVVNFGDAGAASAASQVSSNAGGFGVKAQNGGVGNGVQGWTYSGNTGGTFTPVTALAGGTS